MEMWDGWEGFAVRGGVTKRRGNRAEMTTTTVFKVGVSVSIWAGTFRTGLRSHRHSSV
jgi:hypothetical protein